MKLNTRSIYSSSGSAELGSVHNYYEGLVMEELARTVQSEDDCYIADLACVALNHLPPRYIRYHVDMSFYLSPLEHQEIIEKVQHSVKAAIKRIGDINS